MKYIICISGFHKEMAYKIKDISKDKDTRLCFLPKGLNGISKLNNGFKFFKFLLLCAFDKDAHVILPHVFNPYFSIILKFSQKHSFYDDGIAYYYESQTPSNFLCRVYLVLAKKSNPCFRVEDLGRKSYFDYVAGSDAEIFYCIFPDLLGEMQPKKIKVCLDKSECCREKGKVIYLDTTSNIADKLRLQKVLAELKRAAGDNGGVIYFKSHPSEPSSISKALRIVSWARELDVNYEEYLRDNGVERMYSIYSSAVFSTHLICPKAELFCFTNTDVEQSLKGIKGILHEAGVKFLQA